MAGFVAENVISGKIKQFFWDDVEKLIGNNNVTILDVRTDTERAFGKIEGSIHIPVDSLRDNISRIPHNKPVYVHCHSGLRSYIACRMLSAHGYECYNLAGGYRFYESVIHQKTIPEYNCKLCK